MDRKSYRQKMFMIIAPTNDTKKKKKKKKMNNLSNFSQQCRSFCVFFTCYLYYNILLHI